MKRLKAILSIIVIVVMLASGIWALVYFAKDSENKKIVVTTFPIYDICVNILGSDDEVKLLQDNGVDMHSYALTFQDKLAINNSELFIYIGGHSDSWVGDVIRTSDNVNMKDLALIDHVDALHESTDNIVSGSEHHHEHEEHEHDSDCEYDEHIWLSVRNMIKMTEVILENIIDVFPHFELLYRENAKNYIDKLTEVDEEFERVCEGKDTTIVLADRFPFLYLASDYGLNFVSAFSGCSANGGDIASVKFELIDIINNNELNYICKLETSDDQYVRAILDYESCRSGVQIVELNSCQSVVSNDIASMSYIEIMKSNLKNIEKVLNNETN
jgi:zinc transport system substrate-binding protein